MPVIPASTDSLSRTRDVLIVGAGPAGIALALDCAAAGLDVLVLEEGGETPSPALQAALDAKAPGTPTHDPPSRTSLRALGGASHGWTGRCLPLDPFDFQPAPGRPETGWPLPWEDYANWIGPAAEFLDCGEAFTAPPPEGWDAVEGVDLCALEQRARTFLISRAHADALGAARGPTVALGAKVLGFEMEDDGAALRVAGLRVRWAGGEMVARGREVALACGGLEVTRLLLAEQRMRPTLFGGPDGPLGRFYMGHLTGRVATIAFARPDDVTAFAFQAEPGGFHARRRLIAPPRADSGAPNGSDASDASAGFWVDTPSIGDPAHGSAALSLKFLAMTAPLPRRRSSAEDVRRTIIGRGNFRRRSHLPNIIRAPGAAARGLAAAIGARWSAAPRDLAPPERTPGGLYALPYHAEHLPSAESRIRLADAPGCGGARLAIDFRYSRRDIASVLGAHDRVAAALSAAGVATVAFERRFSGDREAVREDIRAQARDGYHQIGATRMGADARSGVVDGECRVFGFSNLHIASSSVFPTSGQANPTLSIVAFARRLAHHLKGRPRA